MRSYRGNDQEVIQGLTEKEKVEKITYHIAVINEEMGQLRDEQKTMREEHEKMREAFHDSVKELRCDLSNGLSNIYKSINEMNTKIVSTSMDVDWLKKFLWVLITAVSAAIVTNIADIMMRY